MSSTGQLFRLPKDWLLAGCSFAAHNRAITLQAGVAFSVIALSLDHECMTTTYRFVEADLAMQKATLARLQEPGMEPGRHQPPDALMQFLLDL